MALHEARAGQPLLSVPAFAGPSGSAPYVPTWLCAAEASGWLPAAVRDVTAFGIYADVAVPGLSAPVGGLVYATEMDRYLEDLAAEFCVDQEIKVRVLGCEGPAVLVPSTPRDAGGCMLLLSMRSAPETAPDPRTPARPALAPVARPGEGPGELACEQRRRDAAAFLDVPPSTWLTGVVSLSTPIGVFVDLWHPRQLVRAVGLAQCAGSPPGAFRIGQRVLARVLSVDMRACRVAAELWQPWRAEDPVDDARPPTPDD